MITICPSAAADAAAIVAVQRRAFEGQARLYNDPTLPPLIETVDEYAAQYSTHRVLKAVQDNERIVGAVRGRLIDDTCHISRLVVEPILHNRGIATRLMLEMERLFAEAERFELYTGGLSGKSIHLYSKLGYRIFRRSRERPTVELVHMEKRRGR